ncbi:hypothetical protein [Conexibacter woesei]|uniref:Uncharacterized protein n=1 Tax=Conexibacter woesei (strain DSM 14684 / CCUG 47730 / CIP 108061 / JCM 11494 / NBRC 100937 / ID131577) TaxID=469383 RepID=D3F108_CONWI|nr:hypothetical protein [Conexibacter woesei]ADB50084.1 hypothetical protein Cwoe_1657 [Conexibacter woesei DSM 14684]
MNTFGIVVFAVVAAALVVGVVSLVGRERAYEQIGRGRFALDREGAPPRQPREPSIEDEVRMLVATRNARRLRNGEPALDVEAEVARELRELSGGDADRPGHGVV